MFRQLSRVPAAHRACRGPPIWLLYTPSHPAHSRRVGRHSAPHHLWHLNLRRAALLAAADPGRGHIEAAYGHARNSVHRDPAGGCCGTWAGSSIVVSITPARCVVQCIPKRTQHARTKRRAYALPARVSTRRARTIPYGNARGEIYTHAPEAAQLLPGSVSLPLPASFSSPRGAEKTALRASSVPSGERRPTEMCSLVQIIDEACVACVYVQKCSHCSVLSTSVPACVSARRASGFRHPALDAWRPGPPPSPACRPTIRAYLSSLVLDQHALRRVHMGSEQRNATLISCNSPDTDKKGTASGAWVRKERVCSFTYLF